MRASETTKPFDSDASDVTRASQFIQPVSNPTKSPNAVRAYRYAPPGSLKWLAASAKQSTRMNTGTAKISGAQSENGPRSLYDSVGRRKTPRADDGVDAHRHQAPEADGADEFAGSSSLITPRTNANVEC